MNAVLFYFFGAFPLGSLISNSSVGAASRQGYSSLESAARTARSSLNRAGEVSVDTARQGLGSLESVTRQGLGALTQATQIAAGMNMIQNTIGPLSEASRQGYTSVLSTLTGSTASDPQN